ncbi:hypothetical protein QWZ03_08505 [Chitinimonas viridis]|uniref:Uncharacterized protein n=1 Tax=Chitinimonas viridis TaxID=664880 RepID=A0ABT8B3G9_9NEIS|nr:MULTISPECIES: hypothetical protein [Chitinimonas]MDN3576803.1 hypothetical protein [Chitinimonas viridis]
MIKILENESEEGRHFITAAFAAGWQLFYTALALPFPYWSSP